MTAKLAKVDKEVSRSVRLKIDNFNKHLIARAKDIYLGRNRQVFDMGNYVIKTPLCCDGIDDNEWEGSLSNANDDPEEIRYARTRIAYLGEIPIVFMEKVEHAPTDIIIKRLGYYPDWVGSVDCGQVGFNKHGKLVAYDYGYR